MNFDYAKDFIQVAKLNSLNKASQELNISTPALSKRIKSIENYFDCDLFFRTSKGIFLNKNGQLVYQTLSEISNSLEKVKIQLNSSLIDKLKIGIIPSFSLFKLHNRKEEFNSIATLTIENSTSILLEELNCGNLDVIIGDFNNLRNKKLFLKEIYQENFMVVYSEEIKFKDKVRVNIKDIKNESMYIQEPPCDTYNFIKGNSLKEKLNITYMKYYESILANVKTGKGLTLVPQSLATRIDSMYLHQKELEGYKRTVGVASFNQSNTNKIYDLFC